MKHRFSLFFKSCLHQLIFAVPLGLIGYYAYIRLPYWCDSYFGVLDMQKAPLPAQATQPLSFIDSFRSFMMETTLSAKLYMLSAVSSLVANLGQLILDILGLLFIWKLILKCRRSYATKTRDSDLVRAVITELQPEIKALREEVARLSTQLKQKGKNT